MASMDMIKLAGGEPANFLRCCGGCVFGPGKIVAKAFQIDNDGCESKSNI